MTSGPNHEHIHDKYTEYFSCDCQDNECVVVPIKSLGRMGA